MFKLRNRSAGNETHVSVIMIEIIIKMSSFKTMSFVTSTLLVIESHLTFDDLSGSLLELRSMSDKYDCEVP
jgi:hypothetical protein